MGGYFAKRKKSKSYLDINDVSGTRRKENRKQLHLASSVNSYVDYDSEWDAHTSSFRYHSSTSSATTRRDPASSNRLLASESHGTASESRGPASESHGPKSESRETASESRVPASESRGPAIESHGQVSENRGPGSESRGPASGSGSQAMQAVETSQMEDKEMGLQLLGWEKTHHAFGREGHDSALAHPNKAFYLPTNILQHILSFLNWQQVIGVRRVSRQWRDAVDACLSRRNELHIGRFDLSTVLDDDTLDLLLIAMPALKSLSLDWRPGGNTLDIEAVIQRCRNLVEVDLTRFRLNENSLRELCHACPGLEVIKLPQECDDSCVEILLHNLTKLRFLDLAYTDVTGRFLEIFQDSVQKLSLIGCTKLNVRHPGVARCKVENDWQGAHWKKMCWLEMNFTNVGHNGLSELFKYFPPLERLSLAGTSHSITQQSLSKHLRDLDVSFASFQSFDLLGVLTRCSQLERLSLAHSSIAEPPDLRNLYQRLNLRELDVSSTDGLTFADLRAILIRSPSLERLRAARFEDMDLTTCLTHVSLCHELRELDVSRAVTPYRILQPHSGADMRRRQIQPAALAVLLSGCQKLERLLLNGCHIAEPGFLRHLAKCPGLRELDLSRMTSVNPHNLSLNRFELVNAMTRDLRGCSSLERLSVTGLQVPIEQLVPRTGLPSLTYLDVSNNGLTNNSLRRLPGLFPRLRTLSMEGMAGGGGLRQKALVSYLPRLQHLRSLDLRNVPDVTDALLEQLKKSSLTKLRVDGPEQNRNISVEGLTNLAHDCRTLKLLWLEDIEDPSPIVDVIRQSLPLHRPIVFVTSLINDAGNVVHDGWSSYPGAQLRLTRFSDFLD